MRFAKRSQAAGAKKGSLAERFLLFLIHMQEKCFLPGRRDVGRLPVAAALGVGERRPVLPAGYAPLEERRVWGD